MPWRHGQPLARALAFGVDGVNMIMIVVSPLSQEDLVGGSIGGILNSDSWSHGELGPSA